MADVKFSELSSLAAADVATDDIFAVVDTSATTSKKLTVANLMGQVPSGAPLHINDTTDSSSSTCRSGLASKPLATFVSNSSQLLATPLPIPPSV